MERHARALRHRPPFRLAGVIGALAIATTPFAAVCANAGAAPFTVVETGKGYTKLQSAIDAIGSGKGTIAIAPGRIAQRDACGEGVRGRRHILGILQHA